ncbi:hypothetical protein TTY48_03800 [Tsukamurella sp. TY48]|nr:hypothetical protein TTY48_03800 [Tsukamurella sp. TY48]
MTGSDEFVGDEPIPELRIITMDIDRSISHHRIIDITVTDWNSAPGIEGLAGELQNPAGHRDGNPVSGQLADQREHHFGDEPSFRFACDKSRRRPPKDFILLLQQPDPPPRFPQLLRLVPAHTGTNTVIDIVLPQPPPQTRLRDPEILRYLFERDLPRPGHADHISTELLWIRLRHGRSSFQQQSADRYRSGDN